MGIQERKAVSAARVRAEPGDAGQTVLSAITGARSSVDIVIYELGGPNILNALKTAKKNGGAIRLIFNEQFFVGADSNNGGVKPLADLRNAPLIYNAHNLTAHSTWRCI